MKICRHNRLSGETSCPVCVHEGIEVVCLNCTRTDWWVLCRDCVWIEPGRVKHSPRCWRERKMEDAAFREKPWRIGACRCREPY